MTLLQKIQFQAKQKGETLASLDRQCGFSHGTIRRWDTVMPSIDKVAQVARALDVSVDYLCGNVETSNVYGNIPEDTGVKYITDDDLRFALFAGKPATEAQLREVKSFASFIMQRDSQK